MARKNEAQNEAQNETPAAGIDFEALRQKNAEAREMHNQPDQGVMPFIDLSNPNEAFEPMAGSSVVVVNVKGAEPKISSSGNAMIVVRYQVASVLTAPGIGGTEAASYVNRTIRDNVMFLPPNPVTGKKGTLWRAKKVFDALGVDWAARAFTSQADFMAWLQEAAEDMIGRMAIVTVGIEMNEGATNPETGEPYPPRNVVADIREYQPGNQIKRDNPAARLNPRNVPKHIENDEDLPF
jgi:hypothetical protein